MSADSAEPLLTRDLVRWSEALAAIARTGLGFTQNLYERERFEEVLHVAADIKMAVDRLLDPTATPVEHDQHVQEWLRSVGNGVPGYVTPKVAIGVIVGNDAGEVLLVQRADSGIWLFPTGWADVGYSPSPAVSRTGTFRSSDLRIDAAHASPPGGPSRGAWGDDAFSVT